MGARRPKWLVKQERKRIVAARKAARGTFNGNTHKDLGVQRMGRHGGIKKGHGV